MTVDNRPQMLILECMFNETRNDILDFIQEYQTRTGVSPTVRDIREGLDIASNNTVHYHLTRLRAAGVIDWETGKARTIKILPPSGR